MVLLELIASAFWLSKLVRGVLVNDIRFCVASDLLAFELCHCGLSVCSEL